MAPSRQYRSEHRQRQAEQTRAAILGAARHLFSARGYAATAISDIADEAGVSVPTLYASVGNKATIARALIEFVNAEGGVEENDARQRQAATPVELIRRNAHLVTQLHERTGDIIRALRSAAHSEPEVMPVVSAGDRYHREGEYAIGARLAEMGALSDGIDTERAGAILTVLASSTVLDQFVLDHGWTHQQVEDWLTTTLAQLLLADPATD